MTGDGRICAHLLIARLGLLLFRQLRYHLNEKEILLSPMEAMAAVKSMRTPN